MKSEREINHWCVLCGAGYHACDSCRKEKAFAPWRTFTDTIDHYQLFMVLRAYHNQEIDKIQAREMLSHLDLSDKELYKSGAKKVLADIYAGQTAQSASYAAV